MAAKTNFVGSLRLPLPGSGIVLEFHKFRSNVTDKLLMNARLMLSISIPERLAHDVFHGSVNDRIQVLGDQTGDMIGYIRSKEELFHVSGDIL